jgi:hypothetical protein
MTHRSRVAERALTRHFALSLGACLILCLLVWFSWQSDLHVVAWLLAVLLLVTTGFAAASLSGRQTWAALGLLAGSPVVAGSAAASYTEGHTVGVGIFVVGLLALPAALWACLHSGQRRLDPPTEADTTGLQIFGD